MKTLTLKQYTLKRGEPTSTVEMAWLLLDKPEQGWIKIADMKLRLAIQAKLDGVDKEALKLEEQSIELEDAEAAKLKELVKDYPWGVSDQAIIDFDTAINEL